MSTGEEKFLSVMYGFITPDLVIVHTNDITEKKKVLERLKKSEKELKALTFKLKQRIGISEEKYRTIFENTGAATAIIEEDTTISLVNGQFEELSGYSREEIEWKKSWTEFVIKEDLERMKKRHYYRRKDPESTLKKYEFRFVNKEGNIRDIVIIIDVIPGTKKSVASLLNITERKKSEEKIRKNKEFIAEITSNVPGLIFQYELNTKGEEKFNFISDGIRTLMEVEPEAILADNKAIWNTYLEEYIPMIMEKIKESEEKLIPWHVEYQLRTAKTSTIKWVEGLSIPKKLPNGNTIWNGWMRDITERKKAEEKLKDSEEKYRHLFKTSPCFIGLIDTKGVLIDCNDVINEIQSIHTRGDIIGKNITEIFLLNEKNKYLIPIFEKIRKNIFEGAGTNQEPFDFQLYRSSGGYLWLHIEGTLIEIEKQKLIQFIIQDITERKQAERELQLERDNFLNIFNSMEDGVYIIDQNYDIKYVNSGLTKEFGPFEGMKCYKYLQDQNEICPWCKNKEIFQGKTVRWEWYSPKNQKTYDLIGTPLKNPDGSISKLGIFRDITENKKIEHELKESEKNYREAYNRAEFYKDIFAHDINNILQSILSGTQVSKLILENPEELDNLRINAQIIKEQVIRGAKLVSNVRKLSQLEEAGRNLEKIEILNVLKNTVSFVKKSYKDKNLAIRADSIGEKLFVKANDFLEDVFENLLINAIRHNRNLIIDITVRVSKEQQNGINCVKMEFMDNGIGVADSMKERIFKRGHNEEKSVPGMGLGLSLVRGIIETYDGKIWVEDRVKGDRSKGSNFALLIPEVD